MPKCAKMNNLQLCAFFFASIASIAVFTIHSIVPCEEAKVYADCTADPRYACLNGGVCRAYRDANLPPTMHECSCPPGATGDRCQYNETWIIEHQPDSFLSVR